MINVGSPIYTGTPVTVGDSRFINVGVGETYTTIEAGVAALVNIAPDVDDPYYLRLVDAAYQLTDDTVHFPANTGMYGAGSQPSDHTITGVVDRTGALNLIQMLHVADNTIFENFTVIANSGTGSGGHFYAASGITQTVSFRSVICDDDGNDTVYIASGAGGEYNFTGCTLATEFDGIVVFGTETVTVNIDTCYLYETVGAGGAAVGLVRSQNPNLTVNVNNSLFSLLPDGAISQPQRCIRLYPASGEAVLTINNSVFQIIGAGAADADHGFQQMTGLLLVRVALDMNNCQLIMVNDLDTVIGSLQDYALEFTSVTDNTSGIDSGCRIYADNLTLAQAQNDVSGNTVTGFKIT